MEIVFTAVKIAVFYFYLLHKPQSTFQFFILFALFKEMKWGTAQQHWTRFKILPQPLIVTLYSALNWQINLGRVFWEKSSKLLMWQTSSALYWQEKHKLGFISSEYSPDWLVRHLHAKKKGFSNKKRILVVSQREMWHVLLLCKWHS